MRVEMDLGENPRSLSEPDVIVAGDSEVVFIEAKYRSGNDHAGRDDARWNRYLSNTEAFADPALIRGSGLYELARNWRIGWDFAGEGRFALINLAPPELFSHEEVALEMFERGLRAARGRHFHRWTWKMLLDLLPVHPQWLVEYCRQRNIS
ncbi:MAG: hypothetical protein Q8N47_09095 [Bryobacterales bacterium]|nr:hypothetical protein [Bryobacterales bacterium]